MSKIIDGYNQWVVSNGKVFNITEINDEDLKELDNLKDLIRANGVYSVKAYDEFIGKIRDFGVGKCINCEKFTADFIFCDVCNTWMCFSCECDCESDNNE